MDHALLTTLALAAQDATDNGGGEAVSPFGNPWVLWLGLMFLAFYFIVLRPGGGAQKRVARDIEEMGKGDEVVTAGGIHGAVESIDKDKGIVTLSVAPKVHMRFNRTSIASVTNKKHRPKNQKEEKAAD
jgi:preprotein translocase subunit YajC